MATEQPPVTLPASVENLINQICVKQSQPPLDPSTIRLLATMAENQALQILNVISNTPIRTTFNAFTLFMINKHSSQSQSPSQSQSFPLPSQFQTSPLAFPLLEDSGVLTALGELEFRKSFLMLSYAGGESIEKVVTAEYVRSLKDLPMRDFESKIWEAFGKHWCIDYRDRRSSLEWDFGSTLRYECHVSPNGSLRFKGPFWQSTRTHLQKSLGDDNVLVVKFMDLNESKENTIVQDAHELYGRFGKEGIHVGLRLYRFFVSKDGGKEAKKEDSTASSVKCYFVRTESSCSADERESYILSNKTMSDCRSFFMHAHLLPSIEKYMARFSLILSKTYTLNVDFTTVVVQKIPDEYCRDGNGKVVYHNEKECILTDGTGFISEDLAKLCPQNVFKGTNTKNTYIKDTSQAVGVTALSTHQPPLLIQCRLFHMGSAMKGTLLVNRKLPQNTIQVRPSMIKVETDSLTNIPSLNSLEVVTTSQKPNRAYLSKYLIALLSFGGVPNEFFMDVLKRNLEDAEHIYTNKRAALRASVNHAEMDEYNAAGMLLCGIPLDEPFMRYHLSILAKTEKNRLRAGKLYLEDCFYVMGTVDPTESHCLKPNQVCIIHENGQITGDVLVYRNPGLHFGDIHKMQATYVEELESYVGHGKYAIFFPCVGPRSIADEIAGGDFDGDMYWISKNPQLLQYFKSSKPWIESPPCNSARSFCVKKPSELSAEELEEALFRLYLETRFQPSSAIGMAADGWMALMDRLLILPNDRSIEKEQVKENIYKLIDLYYEALDAPKKGGGKMKIPSNLNVEMFPHYMERNISFTSTSILGSIYDEVCRWQTTDMSGIVISKLPCFDVEIPMDRIEYWGKLHKQYRLDMSSALRDTSKKSNEEAAEVIKIYKQKFDAVANFEDHSKNISEIYNEALAVYNVTYDHAIKSNNDVAKCAFAWKVAGSVLIRFYAEKHHLKTLPCNPFVLREIFGS
ncbi:probable RNA-dependent RNA polymerase 5 isoform X2 [Medicago truncatula]|uniref:probable RNA-dependent RNA polymerase 5 isoform X2 n=1 Tax=Medicago truncatula TaxID=3880 RepID=UPI00196723A4|nr:probable RNA-dependent RNA polymerase 5 isoform X2 [Medicago truncatula]